MHIMDNFRTPIALYNNNLTNSFLSIGGRMLENAHDGFRTPISLYIPCATIITNSFLSIGVRILQRNKKRAAAITHDT